MGFLNNKSHGKVNMKKEKYSMRNFNLHFHRLPREVTEKQAADKEEEKK